MANFYDFSSDKISIFFMLIDSSGSMDEQEYDVRAGLKLYQKSFENFPEINSIAVSISKFNNHFYPCEFKNIKNLDTSYSAGGGTEVYYSIVEGEKYLNNYINEVIERTGCDPVVTFILFSDGEDNDNSISRIMKAKKTIEKLNFAGVTTVFCAFGSAITSEFGAKLGFQATIDVKEKNALTNFLGVELSKSCKEQSKSMKGLGAEFFSKAIDSNSKSYSHTTAQALDVEDESWMNDI